MFDSQVDQLRYSGGRFKLKGFTFFDIKGSDSESFLHNFFTCDVKKIREGYFQIGARLNIQAQILLYAYILRENNSFKIFLPKSYSKELVGQFEKYIIAEDVEYTKLENINAYIYFDPINKLNKKSFKGVFLGEPVKMIIQDEPHPGFEKIQPYALKILSYLTGWPIGDEEHQTVLINTLFLNSIAVDYQKGCFLGQETAAKIENNRGGATFPLLLLFGEQIVEASPGEKIYLGDKEIGIVSSLFIEKEETFIVAQFKREWRVEVEELKVSIGGKEYICTVRMYPFFMSKNKKEKSIELMEEGLALFQEDDFYNAKLFLDQAIKLDRQNADAYESLGVILGREGKFEKAIELMNQLEKVDPSSVMSHTNKSLYLMKLGRIEEAEEEKAQATVKTFERLGREAKLKKEQGQEEEKKKQELLSRKKMFQEVLELDEQDEFANIQLAAIMLELGELAYVQNKFTFLYENYPQNPELYVVLLRYLVKSDDEIAKKSDLLEQGKALAAKKGNQKVLSQLAELERA